MVLRSFTNNWRTYCPYIDTLKPSSDLCDVCQKNINAITKTQNTNETARTEKLQFAIDHFAQAKKQREFYQEQCARAAAEPRNKLFRVLAFDYAQTVSYPSAAQAVGSIYFKSARKLELFGIFNHNIQQQHTYVIDEAHHAGNQYVG